MPTLPFSHVKAHIAKAYVFHTVTFYLVSVWTPHRNNVSPGNWIVPAITPWNQLPLSLRVQNKLYKIMFWIKRLRSLSFMFRKQMKNTLIYHSKQRSSSQSWLLSCFVLSVLWHQRVWHEALRYFLLKSRWVTQRRGPQLCYEWHVDSNLIW